VQMRKQAPDWIVARQMFYFELANFIVRTCRPNLPQTLFQRNTDWIVLTNHNTTLDLSCGQGGTRSLPPLCQGRIPIIDQT
jgi:hypothetical protein